jgi:hypothetical protein
MRIDYINTRNMRNDAHFQFFTEFRNLAQGDAAVLPKIQQLFDEWLRHYALEDDALKKIVKSVFTGKIQETDAARDEIYNGMVEINRATLKHFSAEKREAAEHLKILFDTYGDVAKKPLKDQTSAVYNILQELKGSKYAPFAAIVGIGEWIAQLETLNRELEALTAERSSEAAAKTDIVLKDARAEVDRLYVAIVRRINAYIEIEGAEAYQNFVRTLNINIAKSAAAIGKRRKRLNQNGQDSQNEQNEDSETEEDV